tara:strand:+ start:158 stop:481 length:324 start_codon:yes stop_codon:yes gene_type:complete
MASDIRDVETIFRNVCAGCHVRGGSIVLKGSKSLKLSDIEKRGIADVNSITIIANSEPSSSLNLTIAAPFIKPSTPTIRLFNSAAASKRETEFPLNFGLFVRSFNES